jgi:hypothetical protein
MSDKIVNGSKKILRNVSKGVNKVLDTTENKLGDLLDNSYVSVSLKVFLALYAAFVAPEVPKNFALLMDSTIVRIIFAALIVYSALKDPVIAILLSIIFVITLQTAAKYKIYSTSESVLSPGGISWLPSAKQGAVVHSGNSSLLGDVENVAGNLVGGVQQLGSGLVSGVENVGSGIVSGASGLGTSVLTSAEQIGSGLVGGVQHLGSGLVGGVQQFGSGLVGGVRQVGSSVSGGVQELGSGLVSGVQELGSSVSEGVQELGSGLVGSVRQVGSGVSSGIKSMVAPLGLEHLENPTPADKNCAYAPFTSEEQFNDAESNLIAGADQGSCMQTFSNQYCIQGAQSNWVQGY